MTKRPGGVRKPEGDPFADLAAEAERQRRERSAEAEEAAKTYRVMAETHRRIAMAADGTAETPTARFEDVDPREVVISNEAWATFIVPAARAWAVWPGADALDRHPLPDRGLGIDAGIRIWKAALSGASEAEVTALLVSARAALGAWDGTGLSANSELGILYLFRQLRRHLGSRWDPPISTKNPRPSPAARGPSTSKPGPSATTATSKRPWKGAVLQIDLSRCVAVLRGEAIPVTRRQGEILQRLLDAGGGYVAGHKLREFQDEKSGERPDRIIKSLPEPLRDLIESKRGSGYRIPFPLE